MADKVSAGQPIPRSAALWNNLIGSANEYAGRQLGQPGGRNTQPIATDIIKIKNSSGTAIRLGEVLEISGFLLASVVRDSLWFDGDTPDTTRPFAIALQDIPDGSIDRAQVSGACVALVNVTDEDHGYAVVADGELVLQSATTGPIRILFKPTGTDEFTCAVLFAPAGTAGTLVELCAQESAERNVPYTALLGTWNAAEGIWCYDDAPTVYAIDHRMGAPYAEEGWKGLYQAMPSSAEGHNGTLYICVSLDCEEPEEGCNDCEEE